MVTAISFENRNGEPLLGTPLGDEQGAAWRLLPAGNDGGVGGLEVPC